MIKSVEKFINKIKIRFKAIFSSELTARQIALNCTVGILIGLLIPMGLQTIGVIALCAVFKLNFVIVVFTTLITNPFTVIFIYYSAFTIGEIFINSGITWASVNAVLNYPELEALLSLSYISLKVIYTGLIIESIIIGSLTFILAYYIAETFKNKKKFAASKLKNL